LDKKDFADFAEIQLGLEKNRLWHTSLTDLLSFFVLLWVNINYESVIAGYTPVGTLVYMMATCLEFVILSVIY